MTNLQGFRGVRFNPYLWPKGGSGMKDDTGLAMYRKAGELNMPVGVMCFKGFGLHVGEIKALLESFSDTKVTKGTMLGTRWVSIFIAIIGVSIFIQLALYWFHTPFWVLSTAGKQDTEIPS